MAQPENEAQNVAVEDPPAPAEPSQPIDELAAVADEPEGEPEVQVEPVDAGDAVDASETAELSDPTGEPAAEAEPAPTSTEESTGEAQPVEAPDAAGLSDAAAEPAAEAESADADEPEREPDDAAEPVDEASSLDEDAAAERIQARQRGRADRRRVAEMSSDAAVESVEPVDAAEAVELAGASEMIELADTTDATEDTLAADVLESTEASSVDEDAAAARIQARQRGRADRRRVAEMSSDAAVESVEPVDAAEAVELADDGDVQSCGMDEDTAAAQIQAMQRGKMARKEHREMTAAATKIQKVHRGKAARRSLPQIEDRLLSWSEDWYIAMQTIARATGVPFIQSKYRDLTAQETTFLKQKFEVVKQQRFEGGEADFWKFVAASFVQADVNRSGMLDFEGFESLCGAVFGSFGDLQAATGESLQEFFRRADADRSGKVSFAELVAVFVVDEQRSPELKHWIQSRLAASQQAATTAGAESEDSTTVVSGDAYVSEEFAAIKIQARHRGNQTRKLREYGSAGSDSLQSTALDEDAAARRIQSMHRGKTARNETRQMRLNRDMQEQTDAAVRIQAVHRGREARRSAAQGHAVSNQSSAANFDAVEVSDHERLAQKLDGRLDQLETGAWVQQQEEEMDREDAWRAEQAEAATRIQARQRGKQARRQANTLRVDTGGQASVETFVESEASPPAQPWPAGHSPVPQKSRLPLPVVGYGSVPSKPHSKVRFDAGSPQPVPPADARKTPPNGGRALQAQRGHAGLLDPLSHGAEQRDEPDYDSDPFVVALNGKREKIEQQVAALQSRIIEQTTSSASGADLDAMDGDSILEEAKVFSALNAQMEQLVSLENEFLRAIDQQKKLLLARHMAASNPMPPPAVIRPLPGSDSPSIESDNSFEPDRERVQAHNRRSKRGGRIPQAQRRSLSNSPHGFHREHQRGHVSPDMPMGENRTGGVRHGRKSKRRDIAARTAERAAELDRGPSDNERGTSASCVRRMCARHANSSRRELLTCQCRTCLLTSDSQGNSRPDRDAEQDR